MSSPQTGRGAGAHFLSESPATARLMTASSDLAVVVDSSDVVTEVSLGDGVEAHATWNALLGTRWSDTLTRESLPKLEPLLREARQGGRTKRAREMNLKLAGLGEVPMRFTAVLLDDGEHVAILGRDLRPISSLQQRLITTQQAIDREYDRLRQADTRYRVLFHVSSEAVLVADGLSRRVLEANPAAASLLGDSIQGLQGQLLHELFDATSRAAVQGLVAATEAGAPPADIEAELPGQKDQPVTISASLFRQSGTQLVLLRVWRAGATTAPSAARTSRMLAVMEALPDGLVVTGEDRRILSANTAFCEIVQQANEKQILGEPLDRWVGRPGVDLNIMFANLREHGSVRNFSTILRSDFGPSQEALVTAVSALDGKVPCLGFTIRPVSSRLTGSAASAIPRSVEQLRELVGRVSLKELVRESADLIEKLCIEAALDVSGNNRAAAAQLLGLSRQGLYSKLRRHGIAEFEGT
jgi:transcriptional regulator PpsR